PCVVGVVCAALAYDRSPPVRLGSITDRTCRPGSSKTSSESSRVRCCSASCIAPFSSQVFGAGGGDCRHRLTPWLDALDDRGGLLRVRVGHRVVRQGVQRDGRVDGRREVGVHQRERLAVWQLYDLGVRFIRESFGEFFHEYVISFCGSVMLASVAARVSRSYCSRMWRNWGR